MEDEKEIGVILDESMGDIFDSLEKDEPLRDESGKFKAEEPQVIIENAQTLEKKDEEPLEVTQAEEKPSAKPPSTWGKAVQEKFSLLDPDVQAEILKREADQARGIQRYAEDAKFASSIRQIVSPYEHLIKQEGGTPEGAIADLLQTAALLRTGTPEQKAQILLQAARQYGADLSGYVEQQSQLKQLPPEVQNLIRRQEMLEAEIVRRDAEQKRLETLRQQSDDMAAVKTVEDFATQTDASGNLAHPFFAQVRSLMGGLASSGQAQDLEDAYKKACWAVPEIRSILIEQETAQRAEQQRRQAAQRAASVNVKTRGVPSGKAAPSTIDETMNATYDALFA